MRRVAAFVALLVLIGMFTACAEDDSLRLTFDGESCTYEGPTELPAGTAELVFVNEGEGVATAYLVSLFEGYTAEDLIDDIGQEPSEKYWRSWQNEIEGSFSHTGTGERHEWEGELRAGNHALMCLLMPETDPFLVWFGTGLSVEG